MRKVHGVELPEKMEGVRWTGRTIGESVWGRAWSRHLERYGDFANRLPRGRTYLRQGAVWHLEVVPGEIRGLVLGSRLYTQQIQISPLGPAGVERLIEVCGNGVTAALDIVRGRIPGPLLDALRDPRNGLFPDPGEIQMSCSCPDWAQVCKHVAAVLYGVGVRLDARPELLFVLRGVDPDDLVRGMTSTLTRAPRPAELPRLVHPNLSALFDIDLDDGEGSVALPPDEEEDESEEVPTLRRSELLELGLSARLIDRWLRSGVLLRTERRGHYALTQEAWREVEPLLEP